MIFSGSNYTGKVTLKLFEYSLRGWVHPAEVFVSLFAEDEAAFWLDREFHPTNRKTIIGHAFGKKVCSPEQVELALQAPDLSLRSEHFTPGFIGFLEYPKLPKADYETVAGEFLEVREALVFDHDKRQIHLVGRFENESAFRDWTNAVLLRLGIMGGHKATYLLKAGESKVESVAIRHSREKYLRLIEQAQQHIALGDVYQVCLTNEIRLTGDFDPLAIFLSLRLSNPAPFASYLRIGKRTVVSSSPEEFFSLKDSLAVTKPIKGTRPRMLDVEQDALVANELRNNVKERAENLMIVDLMRNDFSRFCDEDTVKVEKLFDVESYSTVHQLVSTVSGRLRGGMNPFRALLMAFPGGSMTGAPKLRAQQLIAELEAGDRGIYSGVTGHIALDGSLELAMNIRCIVFEGRQVSIGVGGGITSDSEPEAEFEEIKLKAKALLGALGASVNW